jgi:protein phosphatase
MRTSEVAQGRPGSTCVAVLMHAGGTEVAHVGDSRAYLVHAGQIFRLTRDHSVVQEMVERGLLTPQQAASHPDANRITRALGMSSEVEADLRPQPVHHVTGDAFVLCSDGLSDLVQDEEILSIVGAEPAAQAVGKLVDLANARGGHDNVTVVVLRARENALAPAAPVPPTIAQTETIAPATVPLPAATTSAPTLVEPRGDRQTQPILAPAPGPSAPPPAVAPPSARPLEPTIPPSRSTVTARRRTSPMVALGVVLGLVAVAILGWLVLEELAERRGKHSAPPRPILLVLDGGDTMTAPTPSPSAPSAAPPAASAAPASTPAPTPTREPIAPLETAPPRSRHAP